MNKFYFEILSFFREYSIEVESGRQIVLRKFIKNSGKIRFCVKACNRVIVRLKKGKNVKILYIRYFPCFINKIVFGSETAYINSFTLFDRNYNFPIYNAVLTFFN